MSGYLESRKKTINRRLIQDCVLNISQSMILLLTVKIPNYPGDEEFCKAGERTKTESNIRFH